MAALKQIRTRIKGVGNIRKITKAMELVSVSKMKRSVNAVLASRPYAEHCKFVLRELSRRVDASLHPLFLKPEVVGQVLIIVVSADRGLCGNFNNAVLEKTEEFVRSLDKTTSISFISVGKKIEEAVARKKWNLTASFINLSIAPTASDILPIANIAKSGFLEGKFDHVFLIYTDFISTVKQRAMVQQLLPVTDTPGLGEVNNEYLLYNNNRNFEFLFEPKRGAVLDFIIPRLIEVKLYQAVLESVASEHSARMLAMKNASEAASDIVSDLTLSFNQLRQATITSEIAEISAGRAVLGV